MNGDQAKALAVAMQLGSRLVRGVWILVCTTVALAVGGAVYLTKLDGQVTGAVGDIAQVRLDISAIAANVVPRAELLRAHDALDLEDRRLQIQIDRLEAAADGRPYNGRGFSGP